MARTLAVKRRLVYGPEGAALYTAKRRKLAKVLGRKRRTRRVRRMRRKRNIPLYKFTPQRKPVLAMMPWRRFLQGQTLAYSTYAGDYAFGIFKMNSIINTDVSPGTDTHEPLGYAEYKALYGTYRVLKIKVTLVFHFDVSAANNVPLILYMWQDITSTPAFPKSTMTHNTFNENLKRDARVWRPVSKTIRGLRENDNVVTLTGWFYPDQLRKMEDADPSAMEGVYGSPGTDPGNLYYIHYAAVSPSTNTAGITFSVDQRLDFYVVNKFARSLARSD